MDQPLHRVAVLDDELDAMDIQLAVKPRWLLSSFMLAPVAAVYSSLLIVTGLAKLSRPNETSRALAMFGLPSGLWVGWSLGAVEVTVGFAALVLALQWAYLAQGLLYLGFAVWVLVAIRSNIPLSSCGCLGRDDTPPYWGHLVLDLGGAAVTLFAVAIGTTGGPQIALSLVGVTHLALIGVGVFLGWLVLDAGARLYGARHP